MGLSGRGPGHLDADVASSHVGGVPAGLGVGRRQPEAVDVGKVVARSPRSLALHEGLRPEVPQATARRRQRLTAALVAGARVLGIGRQQNGTARQTTQMAAPDRNVFQASFVLSGESRETQSLFIPSSSSSETGPD